jgi:hypothetical protein
MANEEQTTAQSIADAAGTVLSAYGSLSVSSSYFRASDAKNAYETFSSWENGCRMSEVQNSRENALAATLKLSRLELYDSDNYSDIYSCRDIDGALIGPAELVDVVTKFIDVYLYQDVWWAKQFAFEICDVIDAKMNGGLSAFLQSEYPSLKVPIITERHAAEFLARVAEINAMRSR